MKPYTIRRVRPQALIPLVGVPVFFVIVGPHGLEWVLVAVWVLLAAGYLARGSLQLRVDERGVWVAGGAIVPWSSVREVRLDGERLTVRLHAGDDVEFPAEGLDRAALAAAVEGFGHVPLRSC